jgi:hypothetical protein
MGRFDNLAYAYVFPFALNTAAIVRRAAFQLAPEISVRLAPSSQGSALAIFYSGAERDLCLGESRVQWEGIEYAVSFVPHNATEYNFDYTVGFLATIFIYRFPMQQWKEKSIAKAVSPFGALVAVDPVSFSDTYFSSISIVVHVECISKIPRILVVKEGGHGTLAWIDVVGFLDLSLPPSPPPSPPLPPAPGFIPVLSSSSDGDSLAGFSEDTLSDRMSPRPSPISVLASPGGASSFRVSQDIADHLNPSEEVLLAVPETMMEQMGASAMMMLGGAAEAADAGDQTPSPTLPAPGFIMTGGLEDMVRPIPSEDREDLAADQTSSPVMVRKREARGTDLGEADVYDLSSLFMTPSHPKGVPQEGLAPVMEAVLPKRSKRIAQQSDSNYISAVDKAVQKKAREVQGIGEGAQLAQAHKKPKSLATDAGAAAHAPLQVGDLLYLGKVCGFAEAELMEIQNAANRFDNE